MKRSSSFGDLREVKKDAKLRKSIFTLIEPSQSSSGTPQRPETPPTTDDLHSLAAGLGMMAAHNQLMRLELLVRATERLRLARGYRHALAAGDDGAIIEDPPFQAPPDFGEGEPSAAGGRS